MQKHSILDVWKGSECASAEKQDRCAKRTPNAATWNVNLHDMFFKILQW